MAAVVWAAELLKKLEETGTPRDKVQCVRDAMHERWEATAALKDTDPARHVTAAEAVGVLESRHGAAHGTVKKAKQVVETGTYEPPPPPVHPAELIPEPPAAVPDLSPAGDGGEPDKPPVGPKPKPAHGKRGGHKKADKPDGKPTHAPHEVPGPVNLVNAEVDAVGPKPFDPDAVPQG